MINFRERDEGEEESKSHILVQTRPIVALKNLAFPHTVARNMHSVHPREIAAGMFL